MNLQIWISMCSQGSLYQQHFHNMDTWPGSPYREAINNWVAMLICFILIELWRVWHYYTAPPPHARILIILNDQNHNIKIGLNYSNYFFYITATVAAKKAVMFSFRSALLGRRRTIHSSHFCSICTHVQLAMMGVVRWCVKMESQLVRSPTLIDSFILPPSSRAVFYCRSSISGEFCNWGSTGI